DAFGLAAPPLECGATAVRRTGRRAPARAARAAGCATAPARTAAMARAGLRPPRRARASHGRRPATAACVPQRRRLAAREAGAAAADPHLARTCRAHARQATLVAAGRCGHVVAGAATAGIAE